MAADIEISNEALAEVAAGAIAAIDENSLESSQINFWYDRVLSEVLDWTDWSFLRRYVVLAEITNDRPAEWNYCYAKPSDCSAPIKIRAADDVAPERPQIGPYATPWQDRAPVAFVMEGGKIYCNVETASLVYTTTIVASSDLPPLLRRAFALELASRIAFPLKKDAKLKGEIIQAAEVARQRAISDEENKNPRVAQRYVSDAEYARMGYE